MTGFTLDPTLAKDTIEIKKLDLCYVGLMNDTRYPWLILVPMQNGLVELTDLTRGDAIKLIDEISHISQILQTQLKPHKLNTAALGNQVRQLHIHIIARQTTDAAWPGPVWGVGDAVPYGEEELEKMVRKLGELF